MRALTGRNASKGNGKEMAEGREEAASSEGPKKGKVGKASQAGQSHPWTLRGQAAVRLAVLLGTLKDLLLGTVRKKQSEQESVTETQVTGGGTGSASAGAINSLP